MRRRRGSRGRSPSPRDLSTWNGPLLPAADTLRGQITDLLTTIDETSSTRLIHGPAQRPHSSPTTSWAPHYTTCCSRSAIDPRPQRVSSRRTLATTCRRQPRRSVRPVPSAGSCRPTRSTTARSTPGQRQAWRRSVRLWPRTPAGNRPPIQSVVAAGCASGAGAATGTRVTRAPTADASQINARRRGVRRRYRGASPH